MSYVTVSRMGDRLVAAKRADGDTGIRLRAEARLLEALDHPGLVQLVDVSETDGTVLMRTAFAGTDTWASHPARDPMARAAGIAAVAATLADLHDRGVTHGSVSPDHVIWAGGHRPVLCGLSCSRGDGDTARRADLVGLADLIDEPPLDDGPLTRSLSSLADRLRDGQLQAAEAVELANRIAAGTGGQTGRPPVRRRRVLTSGAVILLAVGVIIAAVATGPGKRPSQPTDGPGLAAPSGSRLDSQPTATRSVPSSASSSVDSRSSEQGPGAGGIGIVLEHAGRRYSVGREGDVVVVGDWNCDGAATPAVLRPETGEVALFGAWPEVGESTTAESSWTVTDGVSMTVRRQSDCDQLTVETLTGPEVLDQVSGR